LLRGRLPLVRRFFRRPRGFLSSRKRILTAGESTLGRTRVSPSPGVERRPGGFEKAGIAGVTVSAGGSDILPGFIEKRRSFIDDYYRRSLRNTISREPGHRWRIIPPHLRVTLHRARLHFHALSLPVS